MLDPIRRARPLIWGAAALLFLLPLVAMSFSNEVNWDLADFAIFGTMLVVACVAYELAAQFTRTTIHRAMAGGTIALAFVLVWLHLAVGLVGD